MSALLMVADRGSGKTSACQCLVESARSRGLSVGGIIAPAVHEEDRCIGYDVLDLATGRSTCLARITDPGVERVGRFRFTAEGLALGRSALRRAAEKPPSLVIVDEVGPLELAGGGWSGPLQRLLHLRGTLLLVARRELAERIAQHWNIPPDASYDLAQGVDDVIATILNAAAA